ncbi:flagellar FlbD family protein [Thermotoga sp. SG1]|uniref:flagellar FlbD family protein n=1 Tax=Thermotoga sp. SG1 TaxID=126739 RepID=UPI000C7771C1|nr:flagellar FlbD family protein [Thermotoga sp. SG1]PLV56794.1 flagellar protein [Thermotoga sp. SG1]
MIKLTKIDGKWFVLNADLIETVEALPDTTITLVNGRKYIVKESVEEVVQRVIEYKRKIFNWWKDQGR